MIYLITVNYYSADLISRLRASIQDSQPIDYCLIIVNNAVDDPTIAHLVGERVVLLETGDNVGFGAACNLGLNWVYQQDPTAIVWLINPDTCLTEGALGQAANFCRAHPNYSIVGTVIEEPSHKTWFAGGQFNPKTGAIVSLDRVPPHSNLEYSPCDWVSGCSLLLNLGCFPTCPYFDPTYFLYYEDFDFCRRYANQGHTVGVTSQLVVIHSPSSITNRNSLLKLQHSTYSYLVTLERYTSGPVLTLRLVRIILYALALLFVKPQIAFGKVYGLLMYLRRVIHLDQSTLS